MRRKDASQRAPNAKAKPQPQFELGNKNDERLFGQQSIELTGRLGKSNQRKIDGPSTNHVMPSIKRNTPCVVSACEWVVHLTYIHSCQPIGRPWFRVPNGLLATKMSVHKTTA